jgi:hypothetical protein
VNKTSIEWTHRPGMIRVTKQSIQLRCEYSDTELNDKRDELVSVIRGAHETEQERVATNKGYKEALEALYSRRDVLAAQIHERGENRLVECACQLNSPIVGVKRIVRLDTGEFIADEPMTDEERQEKLFEDVSTIPFSPEPTTPESTPEPTPEPASVNITFRSFQDLAAIIATLKTREEQSASIDELLDFEWHLVAARLTEKLAARLLVQGQIVDRDGQTVTIESAEQATELVHTWLIAATELKADSICATARELWELYS